MKKKINKRRDLTSVDLTSVEDQSGKILSVSGYSPIVRPLGQSSGGGFRVSFDLSEDSWDSIKDINGQAWQNVQLSIRISRQ